MKRGGTHLDAESREASLVEPLLPQDHQQHEDPGRLPQAELIGELTEEENTPAVDEEGMAFDSNKLCEVGIIPPVMAFFFLVDF